MRKHSKFITILLSALLAVCLVQTIFVQAFATEMGDDDLVGAVFQHLTNLQRICTLFQWKLLKHPKALLSFMVKFQTVVSGAMLCCILFTATVKNMM